jgi:transketolase
VTAEEHSLIGGLGAAVAEILVRKCPVPVEMVGVNDIFTESGTDVELQKIFGLTSKEIVVAARKVVKRK